MKRIVRNFILALLLSSPVRAVHAQQLLDAFESIEGWRALTSEGAHLALSQAQGKEGKCMAMDFDLSGVYGYVIAQRDVSIDLPENYQFTFDMKAEAPINNFEFKVFDEKDNVWWIKKLNIAYPAEWTTQRIKKRHLSFAWGPARGNPLRSVRKIEFVVSCGTGGKGKVYIDNFRFVPIDDAAASKAKAEFVGNHGGAAVDDSGTRVEHWTGSSVPDSLIIDFHHSREFGGLALHWKDGAAATAYDVLASDDGRDYSTLYSVRHGSRGTDHVSTPEAEGRFVKLRFLAGENGTIALSTLSILGADVSASPNALFHAMAKDEPAGSYPKYCYDAQSYWTVFGSAGDTKEALMNEQGAIEVDKGLFSLEPFLYVGGKLLSWNDVKTTPELLDGYLPIPAVTWDYNGEWKLRVEACAAGPAGRSMFVVRYSIWTKTVNVPAQLFIAVRPFQVNPPWQFLNTQGGAAPIESIWVDKGFVRVDSKLLIPMTAPDDFGSAEFDEGNIVSFLRQGHVPPRRDVHDHFGHASAAFAYSINLQPEQTKDILMGIPFHQWTKSPFPAMGGSADQYYSVMRSQVRSTWSSTLNAFQIHLPPSAPPIESTIKSNLAYIFVNRDGPGIQPGSRSYERSWIRDGSLTCSALLRTGTLDEVRQFIDWYSTGQFPSGKIPCVMDSRGPDAVPEHDSHGEYLYAVRQYFMFSHDTTWLRGKWESVQKTVKYIQSLRAERKTAKYLSGTPEERALYGLVPESISHEGYWEVPRHSYWDDFFTLRGLKDATSLAAALGDRAHEKEYAAERDDFRKDLYASMKLAMANKNVSYIPGCAELGDFDATSTTIGVVPGGELGNIPEPQLHNTFDKYYSFFSERAKTGKYDNYTPYETRVIGTFIALGQKDRAEEAIRFFMNDRRPPQWNHWAEVVWQDRSTPKYIGDMPHTWVGSDFIRSVLSMFVLERESDDAHVLAAGIPDKWIMDPAGVSVSDLRTYHGTVGYSITSHPRSVEVSVKGTFDAVGHKLVLNSPLSRKPKKVLVNGKTVRLGKVPEVVVPALPANVEFFY
jgi:hypothetical protein